MSYKVQSRVDAVQGVVCSGSYSESTSTPGITKKVENILDLT